MNMENFTINQKQYIPCADLSWREVHGELVAIDSSNGEYHIFNSVGRLIWLSLTDGCSSDEILEKIKIEYDVNHEKASTDLENFVLDLCERGLLKVDLL